MTTDFDICAVLREEARAQRVSGNEISRRTGLTQAGVAKTLKGVTRPRAATVIRILASLGRDLSWLQDRLNTANTPVTQEDHDGVAEAVRPVDAAAG